MGFIEPGGVIIDLIWSGIGFPTLILHQLFRIKPAGTNQAAHVSYWVPRNVVDTVNTTLWAVSGVCES